MRRLLVLLALLWATPVSAFEYFIATTGNDATSCIASRTIGTPKRTFASGITCLSAGDTLTVRGGIYDEYLINNLVGHSGTSWSAAGKVTIRAYQTETVWLAPTTFAAYWVMYFHTSGQQYVEFNGINIDSRGVQGGFRVESDATGNPHHLRVTQAESIADDNGIADPPLQEPQHFAITQSEDGLQGGHEFTYLTVHGGGTTGEHFYGFYINSDGALVDHCVMYDLRGIALQVYSAYPNHVSPLNITVSNNIIHTVFASAAGRSSGIILDSGSGHVAYNNVIYGLEAVDNGAAIRLYGADQRAYNNTVTGNGSTGIDVRSTATDAVVQNNISYLNGINYVNAGTRTVHDHNLEGINPAFTSPGTNDYSIITGSAAKDTGATIALVTLDFRGTARPYNGLYDIGAYEFALTDPDVDTPAAGTTFVSDTFTGTSGQNLVSGPHIGETGATWAAQTGATAGMVLSDSNRLRGGTIDVTTNSYASGTPVSAEYDVNAPVHTFTTVAGHTVGVWGRMLAPARTGYTAIYNLDPGTLQLWVVNNYVYTQLGSGCSPNFADGSDHTIRLELRDSIKKLYFDSTFCTSSTDNSVTAPGLAGLDIYTPTTAATNSTSFHVSSVSATDVMTVVIPPPQVTVVYRLRFRR